MTTELIVLIHLIQFWRKKYGMRNLHHYHCRFNTSRGYNLHYSAFTNNRVKA